MTGEPADRAHSPVSPGDGPVINACRLHCDLAAHTAERSVVPEWERPHAVGKQPISERGHLSKHRDRLAAGAYARVVQRRERAHLVARIRMARLDRQSREPEPRPIYV